MIYTITFNPSLDYIMHVDCFEEGETNRSKQEEIYPGGKGFNVSTILSRLNLETTALGFVAGFTGEEIVKELKKKHTVILSSHILSEVSAVCDYVLIISHGKLVASDTPENLGKLAEGSNTLEMLIKGEKTQIRLALEGIEGVNSVTMEKDEKQNLWSVKVSTEEQNDIREKVFYKMSEINSPIYEMKSRKVSLEEIFLELTASDKPISADEVPNTPEDKDTDAGRSNETNVKQTSAEISEEQNNDKGGEK